VLFAAMGIGTDIVIDRAPWLQVLLVSRSAIALVSVVILVVVSTLFRVRGAPMIEPADGESGRIDARIVGAIALTGVLDILGLVSFSYGLENAETWLVGLASSFGPAVTILVAVGMLGERLRPVQWMGLTGILAGMIAIGLP
jgi:drug/metabolite transporter (DMT)-like permease